MFAEHFLRKSGLDWIRWQNWFESGQEPFYGSTYFMMKEIESEVSESAFRNSSLTTLRPRGQQS